MKEAISCKVTEIKFRGRTVSGRLVYGDFYHVKGRAVIQDPVTGIYDYVDPASVRQLASHDVDGTELYVGDVVYKYVEELDVWIEYTVNLYGWAVNEKDCCTNPHTAKYKEPPIEDPWNEGI